MNRSRLVLFLAMTVVVVGVAGRPGRPVPRPRGPPWGRCPPRPWSCPRTPVRDGPRREALRREPVLHEVRDAARHAARGVRASSRRRRPQPRARRRPDRDRGRAGAAAPGPGWSSLFGRFDRTSSAARSRRDGKAPRARTTRARPSTSSTRDASRTRRGRLPRRATLVIGSPGAVDAAIVEPHAQRGAAASGNTPLMALLERVQARARRSGWWATRACSPTCPRRSRRPAAADGGASMTLPGAQEPDRHRRPRPAGLARVTGEAADERGGEEPGRRGARASWRWPPCRPARSPS